MRSLSISCLVLPSQNLPSGVCELEYGSHPSLVMKNLTSETHRHHHPGTPEPLRNFGIPPPAISMKTRNPEPLRYFSEFPCRVATEWQVHGRFMAGFFTCFTRKMRINMTGTRHEETACSEPVLNLLTGSFFVFHVMNNGL